MFQTQLLKSSWLDSKYPAKSMYVVRRLWLISFELTRRSYTTSAIASYIRRVDFGGLHVSDWIADIEEAIWTTDYYSTTRISIYVLYSLDKITCTSVCVCILCRSYNGPWAADGISRTREKRKAKDSIVVASLAGEAKKAKAAASS